MATDAATSGLTDGTAEIQPVSLIDKGTHYLIPPDGETDEKSLSISDDYVSILCISDTHHLHKTFADMSKHIGLESEYTFPEADILVHAGDFTNNGLAYDIKSYEEWVRTELLETEKIKHAILIGGNHDMTLHPEFYNRSGRHKHRNLYKLRENPQKCRECITTSTYLEDEGVELMGVKFYGTPWQPEYGTWAFGLPRDGPEIQEKWERIPSDVDVLVSHSPPFGHGDVDAFRGGDHFGCAKLMERVAEINPPFHVFGHVHEGYGVTEQTGLRTKFVNAASCSRAYLIVNKPIKFYVRRSQ